MLTRWRTATKEHLKVQEFRVVQSKVKLFKVIQFFDLSNIIVKRKQCFPPIFLMKLHMRYNVKQFMGKTGRK